MMRSCRLFYVVYLSIATLQYLLVSCGSDSVGVGLVQAYKEGRMEAIFNSDSACLALLDAYDERTGSLERTLTYYLLGRYFDKKGERSIAIECYMEAIDTSDQLPGGQNDSLFSLVFAHLGKLLNYSNVPREAVPYLDKAILFTQQGDTLIRNNCLAQKKIAYHKMELEDSALIKNTSLCKIYTHCRVVNDSIPNYSSSDSSFKYHSHQMGSALKTLQALHTRHLQTKLANTQSRFYLALSVALCLLLSFILIVLYLFFYKKKTRMLTEMNALNTRYNFGLVQVQELLSQIETFKKESVQNQAVIIEKQRQLDTLKRELAELNGEGDDWMNNDVEYKIAKSEIVKRLHKKALMGVRATDDELHSFLETTKEYHQNFVNALCQLDPELSLSNLFLCVLVKNHFLPSEISILLDCSPQALTNRKARLSKKLFGSDSSAKCFDDKIHSLGKEV